ncbi:PrsW family glutamic-type intramembrane protease [Desulfobacterales bacterium HSG2]|nr:PrsW family glutamic-type intramembrane protease [Desulfobacterales bacterium HSG2]
MFADAVYLNLIISALFILLIYALDLEEKEPPYFISIVYVVSIFATFLFGKLKFGLFVSPDSQFDPLFESFVVAALAEESLKISIFMLLVWKNRNFNEEMDGIIYAMIIAAGFAVMENINYTLNYTYESFRYALDTERPAVFYRSLFTIITIRSVPGHLMFATVMGYFLGKAKFGKNNTRLFICIGFVAAVILHGFWNFISFSGSHYFYLYVSFLLFLCIFTIIKMLRETRYGIIHSNLRKKIEKSIRLAKNSGSPDVVRSLKQIKIRIKYLGNIEGDEQDKLITWIHKRFPSPITDFVEDGPNGISERLRDIAITLIQLKKRFDMKFMCLFYLKVFSPSMILIMILIF